MRDITEFYQSDIYKKVIDHYDRVYTDSEVESTKSWWSQTRVWDSYKITSIEPFYYIWKVQQTAQNKTVLDYGCGPNDFKKFWTNIYGVDRLDFSEGSFFPLPDLVSSNFLDEDQKEKYFGIIAICSLHFVGKDSIIQNMNKLLDKLSTGCRAYMTFNTPRIAEAQKEPFSYTELEEEISNHYPNNDYKILELIAKEPKGFLGKEGNVKVLIEKV